MYCGGVGERMEGVDLQSLDVDSFHEAAEIGDETVLEYVYEAVITLNNLTTPLEEDPPSAQMMSFVMNKRDELKYTALHRAVFSRNLAAFSFLVGKGCEVNLKCHGTPLLHLLLATRLLPEGDIFANEAIKVLLQSSDKISYDIQAKDDQGQTALLLAAEYNMDDIVEILLSIASRESPEMSLPSFLDASKDRRGFRPLHKCAISDAAAAATVLLELDVSLEDRNGTKSTPLHIAAAHGSVKVWSLLLSAARKKKGEEYCQRLLSLQDTSKRTPLEVAQFFGYTRLLSSEDEKSGAELGTKSGVELGLKSAAITAVLSHDLCREHFTCAPSDTESPSAPPENIKRLHVLLDEKQGVLRSSDLAPHLHFVGNCRKASMGDVLRVHEWSYVRRLQATCEQLQQQSPTSLPTHEAAERSDGIAHLDGDTAISQRTFDAAMHAAGSLCQAVDMVVRRDVRNAFCAVRPPGHHAGPMGLVKGAPGGPDSHGFCLLNNISIGAAYAMTVHREVIKKVAIVDFDVHHGNGTEETIRWLKPTVKRVSQDLGGFGFGEACFPQYKPWHDEHDTENVLFVSVHGYGPQERGLEHLFPRGAFYPGSGKSCLPTDVTKPSNNDPQESLAASTEVAVNEDADDDHSNLSNSQVLEYQQSSNAKIDKLLHIYEPSKSGQKDASFLSSMPPLILDVGVHLPDEDFVNGEYRHQWRNYFREEIFPRLMEFQPDCIFLSAGFDAHRKDEINGGYIALVEEDYDWVTSNLARIANSVCEGRLVSALEGGYMTKGEYCSSFAKSVKAHVASMCRQSGASTAKYSAEESALEQAAERDIIHSLRLKRQQKREMLEAQRIAQQQAVLAAQQAEPTSSSLAIGEDTSEVVEEGGSSARKRRRATGAVDYVALNKELSEKKAVQE